MRRWKNRLWHGVFVIFLIWFLLTGCTQEGFYQFDEDQINAQAAMDVVAELSLDKYQGRMAGTEGNELAADYIAGYFKEIGLKAPEEMSDYRQVYKQKVIRNTGDSVLEIVNEEGSPVKRFEWYRDFRPVTVIPGAKVKGTVQAPIYKLDDLNQLYQQGDAMEGKILLVDKDIADEVAAYDVMEKARSLVKDLKGLIFNKDNRSNDYYIVSRSLGAVTTYGGLDNEKGVMIFYCTDKVAQALEETMVKGQEIKMGMSFSYEDAQAANVVGIIPGSHAQKKNEYIIVSAHFDHVGEFKDGIYNPGALDNASGTAAMMEIARVLASSGEQPQKSIVFIAFNGEEESMMGSSYYTAHPVYPLESSILINLDMVGARRDIPLEIQALSEEGNALQNDLFTIATDLGIYCGKTVGGSSDHEPFSNAGVDSVLLIQPDMSQIHTLMDKAENTVSQDKLKDVIKLVLKYIIENAY